MRLLARTWFSSFSIFGYLLAIGKVCRFRVIFFKKLRSFLILFIIYNYLNFLTFILSYYSII